VCGFLLRIMVNAVMLFLVVIKLHGIVVDTLGGTLLGAAIIGIANAAIRPLLALTAVPINTLTLGSFTFFTNIITPLMVVKTLPGYQIASFLPTLAGMLVLTLCSFTLSKIIRDR